MGWREQLVGWRNRLLADPGFQRRAARNPLTRWVARRWARATFDLVAGFVYSQTLAACVRTGSLELLRAGPLTAREIARRTFLPVDGTETLLRAAASLDLVERSGPDRWTLGSVGAALIGNPGLTEVIAHHALLYADLADPVALLRQGEGRLAGYWSYTEATRERVAAYSRLMTASQPLVAAQILDAYRFNKHRRLLDIGGGEGAFVQAVLERTPGLQATVMDLPPVAQRARERLDGAGLANRAQVISGDFRRDPLPSGFDVITLVRILHDHDDKAAAKLLAAAHAALAPGARLLIAEPMAHTPGAEPAGDAYFGWYLLAMGSGRPRSASVLREMARTAGFRCARERPTSLPLVSRMLVLTK